MVSGCHLKSDWGAIKIGTESMGGFYDILVKDCTVHDTRGGGIKLLSVDGANIRNVTITNIDMTDVDMPIFVRLGERLRVYRDAPKQSVGRIENVTLGNIKATARSINDSRVSPPAGIFITGVPGHRIGEITLRDISIQLPGGGTAAQGANGVAEQATKYPEFNFFGVLPAFGLYARHVDHLVVSNLAFDVRSPDHRCPALLADVEHFTWTDVRVNGRALPKPVMKPNH